MIPAPTVPLAAALASVALPTPAPPAERTSVVIVLVDAGAKAYGAARKKFAGQLTKILTDAGDPRLVEKECRFERPPFADSQAREK
jgi:hypothetical protein